MLDHAPAILLGLAVAAFLTPLLLRAWQLVAPPKNQESPSKVSTDVWRRSERIATESVIFTGSWLFFLAAYLGFDTPADGIYAFTILGAILGMPTVWVAGRTLWLGRDAVFGFINYFETKYRISIKSWLTVSVLGLSVSFFSLFYS